MFDLLLNPANQPVTILSGALPEVFRFLDLTGVFLNGILGGRLARQKHFDIVGFGVLAVMSGLGGGIIRDVMLNNAPPVALTDKYYLTMAFAGAILAWLWKFDGKWSRRTLIVFDALVLGVWAATGTQKALGLGFAIIPAILMGVITAIGGGMVRDITAGNVPIVFGGHSLYAIPAVLAAALDALLFTLGYPLMGMLAATVVGSGITIMATWKRWVLPDLSDWSISMTPHQWREFQRARRIKILEKKGKYIPKDQGDF
ncbi:MAG: trimeric intracellular cation channel family protein [Mobiluncus porci]|uniref:Trimeric intracellular cation channel family protein n=1 Tax=Mobiluncus porci TaxID=2652278 RepID=A0A7K0K6F8_9ACTO|nr:MULTISPECIES: trimeric intracellular cation channel family protein [Mobiluncus]MCI6585262.1 trimeric intracellular cation channel family protein [Mobiluncus sp.]MDD7541116.1 trimeric intracellular cation channel family protein [Mobiluncus porci]MDY5747575.1 trimeric intracellular cation channel family protein [Mobiluncus porci]MST50630.1 trimeric intracellular cation channel family protein [Mobiluncus porci]